MHNKKKCTWQGARESGDEKKMTTHEDYCLQEYKYLFDRGILNGSVAFITGGGSGIGFRIAELYMRHGCNTVIASRNVQKLVEVNLE